LLFPEIHLIKAINLRVMNPVRRLFQCLRDLMPVEGFHVDRPVVVIQSDDWGRVGLRDQEGMEELRAAGLNLGERPYDFYSFETSEDLLALAGLLKQHRDSAGNHPSLVMNFIVANLDFGKMSGDSAGPMLPLADGLPEGWKRPNLLESYRAGIAEGIFYPALHGTTHFCRQAVERALTSDEERKQLLQLLWRARTPYIHWRMPWIGYEYCDPEQGFLSPGKQHELIGQALGWFAKLFTTLPRSACAPGYRANDDTHHCWAQHGVRVAQNGPGTKFPPHFGRYDVLHLSRNVEFEPAVDSGFSVGRCLQQAEQCFERGIPAIVSVHSINFHSTVKDFRSETVQALDQFLGALESKHPDLLYVHDEQLRQLICTGSCESQSGKIQVHVTKKRFSRRQSG
jgi:hypothetical protein